ncbi:MAG: hypothetical protein HRU20_31650 [Pseudomonadales bacterium]|nr:hypothetical protein [Pseudomonadales bacterium]
MASSNVTNPSANESGSDTKQPLIISKIKDEHKYSRILMSALKDQLAEYSIGKTADYNVMFEIMTYMGDYPDKFNHPAKLQLIEMVIKKDSACNDDLELILAEKKQLKVRSSEVLNALRSLLKDESILIEEQLKIFSKDYVDLVEMHMAVETQQLIPLALELLSEREFTSLSQSLEGDEEHDFAAIMESRYKSLHAILHKRWEEFEDAANEFALAEFLSMGAMLESIGPITVGAGEISKLVKEYSYRLIMSHYECYKDLFSEQPEAMADYYQKPMDCMKGCYAEYKVGMVEISDVMRKTGQQIVQPYSERQAFKEEKDSGVNDSVDESQQRSA